MTGHFLLTYSDGFHPVHGMTMASQVEQKMNVPNAVKELCAIGETLWEDALAEPVKDMHKPSGPPPGLLAIPTKLGCDLLSSDGMRSATGQSTVVPNSHSGDALQSAGALWFSENSLQRLASADDNDCQMAAIYECSSDSDESSFSEDGSADVLVGPTDMAVSHCHLTELWLPTSLPRGGDYAIPIRSNPRCLSLGDVLRLSEARSPTAPLSFGSTFHVVTGDASSCRPCMFERWPGRCRKSWLCDFCHLHTGRGKPVEPCEKSSCRLPSHQTKFRA